MNLFELLQEAEKKQEEESEQSRPSSFNTFQADEATEQPTRKDGAARLTVVDVYQGTITLRSDDYQHRFEIPKTFEADPGDVFYASIRDGRPVFTPVPDTTIVRVWFEISAIFPTRSSIPREWMAIREGLDGRQKLTTGGWIGTIRTPLQAEAERIYDDIERYSAGKWAAVGGAKRVEMIKLTETKEWQPFPRRRAAESAPASPQPLALQSLGIDVDVPLLPERPPTPALGPAVIEPEVVGRG